MSPEPKALPLQEDLPRMGLLEHLDELRKAILRALGGVVAAFLGCWLVHQQIYSFLARPIEALLPPGEKLVFLGVTDPFRLYIKITAVAAIFVSAPWILFQVWRFVAPGLYRHERHYVVPFILFGTFFFLSGGAFAYYIAFPFAAEFLLTLGATQFQAMITVDRYLGFLLTVILGLGLMFQMPVLIFVLSQVGLVTPAFLLRHFRWAVLIIFIVAAIITPTPDVVNLCLFAVPTLGLYLLGVLAAAVVQTEEDPPWLPPVRRWVVAVFALGVLLVPPLERVGHPAVAVVVLSLYALYLVYLLGSLRSVRGRGGEPADS